MTDRALVTLGLVMPVHNRRALTLQALGTLARVDRTGFHLRIVVVDDGSADGTSEAIASEHPEVEVVRGDGSLFYGGGVNAGLAHLLERPPDFVVLANDDAVFPAATFQQLLAVARTRPRSAVGALLLRWDTPHVVFQVGQRWDTWYGGWRIPTRLTAFTVPSEPWEVEGLPGNCTLLPASAFAEVGLYDTDRFPHHWADAEFSARLRRRGWRLWVAPGARLFCQPNTNPTSLGRLGLAGIVNALFRRRLHPLYLPGQFWKRWYTAPTKPRAVAAFVVYLIRLGFRGAGVGRWPNWPDPPIGASALPR